MTTPAGLYAVSDLHVSHPENRDVLEALRPRNPADWLIVAGDVAETVADVDWALRLLAGRFARVLWVPGNHELWTPPTDPVTLRGAERYDHLVALCRELGVLTPEDPYPVWSAGDRPVVVAPLFQLYDYSFLPPGVPDTDSALRQAYDVGVVCSDEFLLHPDPYPSRAAWCADRVARTEARLDALDPHLPTVLVSHWPLLREPTDPLFYPEFSLWCGTTRTAHWPQTYRAVACVYGHLHIPRSHEVGGLRMEEVSVGYPREWKRWRHRRDPKEPRRVL
ncbi:metallophosphoesterase [Spiractinospora alimapuensis]|uniref:metallophosphoesterase family protein n=1 Tax=Spiractinospora alimapuensis TaxID=2820884 RepID=UPI001F39961E|nr:metallophosphoesterase [Spiractinospora alimapuensis]QVQ54411.1 metallophosphoesterase [Spiractinospora alimapuensis]